LKVQRISTHVDLIIPDHGSSSNNFKLLETARFKPVPEDTPANEAGQINLSGHTISEQQTETVSGQGSC
jgi:hypothetical protein